MAETLNKERYVFQCKTREFRDRIIEQHESGSLAKLQRIGFELLEYAEGVFKQHPEFFDGHDVKTYVKLLVNGG